LEGKENAISGGRETQGTMKGGGIHTFVSRGKRKNRERGEKVYERVGGGGKGASLKSEEETEGGRLLPGEALIGKKKIFIIKGSVGKGKKEHLRGRVQGKGETHSL